MQSERPKEAWTAASIVFWIVELRRSGWVGFYYADFTLTTLLIVRIGDEIEF